MGWFSDFKLHLIMNDEGSLLAVKVTEGYDDEEPVLEMVDNVVDSLYGHKGMYQLILKEQFVELGSTLSQTNEVT